MPNSPLYRIFKWHGVGDVVPTFDATWETFQYAHDGMTVINMHRPKSFCGMVWDVGGRARADLTPLAELTEQGLRGLSHPTFSIAGHLIAVALTGIDAPENLAPVSTRTNQDMTRIEGEIRKLAQSPHFLEVTIPAYYDGVGEDGRIAKGFVYKLYTPDRQTLLKTFTVHQPWLNPVAYAYEAREVAVYAQLHAEMRTLGWKIEEVAKTPIGDLNMAFLKGHLPPPEQRVNACMDYMLIAKRGFGLFEESFILAYLNSISLRAGFPEQTRQMALKCSIVRNNNRLISDASGNRAATLNVGNGVVSEFFEGLIEGGGNNGPQIDHIVPESLGGPNCFSNAQVTSAHYNASKGASVESFQYRDERWKEAMRLKLLEDPHLAPWVG